MSSNLVLDLFSSLLQENYIQFVRTGRDLQLDLLCHERTSLSPTSHGLPSCPTLHLLPESIGKMVPPPSDPPPEGDVDRGKKLNIVMWTLYAIALLLLVARVLTRTRLLRSWGWDDTFACLAMVLFSPKAFSNSALSNCFRRPQRP